MTDGRAAGPRSDLTGSEGPAAIRRQRIEGVNCSTDKSGKGVWPICRRVGVHIPKPVRRFLDGDVDSWLRVEEYQEGDTLVVKAEVPGIDPDQDVEITLTGNQLHLDVRREEKSEHKSKHGCHSEFHYGTFSRSVTLAPGVNKQDLRATYNDGVLEVRIPVPNNPTQPPARYPSPAAE